MGSGSLQNTERWLFVMMAMIQYHEHWFVFVSHGAKDFGCFIRQVFYIGDSLIFTGAWGRFFRVSETVDPGFQIR